MYKEENEDHRGSIDFEKKGQERRPGDGETDYFSEDFCTALDTSTMPVYIIDPDNFNMVYCNHTLQRLIGRNALGEPCYKAVMNLDSPCRNCIAMKLHKDGINETEEYAFPKGKWMVVRVSPLVWKGKKLYKLTGIDISDKRRLEEDLRLRNEEYSAVVHQSTLGILRYDIRTDIAAINVDRNLKRTEEYVIHDYSKVLFETGRMIEESIPEAEQLFADIRSGRTGRSYDIGMLVENGGRRWCHMEYALIRDHSGEPHRAVIFFRDNTEQREKEIAYQRWNARLNALMSDYTAYMEANLSRDVIEAEGRYGE